MGNPVPDHPAVKSGRPTHGGEGTPQLDGAVLEEPGQNADAHSSLACAARRALESAGSASDRIGQIERSLLVALAGGDRQALLRAADDEGGRSAREHLPIAVLTERVTGLFQSVARAAADLGWAAEAGLTATLHELQSAALAAVYSAYVAEQSAAMAEIERRLDTLAGDNERLRHTDQALVARVSELAALQKVNSAVNSTLDLSEVLAQTVDVVSNVTRADVCSIFLYEESRDELVLSATRGLNDAAIGKVTLRVGEGITGAAAREGRPIAVRDAWSDTRFKYAPGLEEEPYHSMVCIPIVLFTVQKLIGVLSLHTREYRDFGPEDIRFLETVAGQIAIAIHNARHYGQTDEKLRQKVNQLTTLQRVSSMIASTLDLQQVLNQIAAVVVDLVGADMSAIFELDEASGDLTIVASHGLSEDYARSLVIKPGEGPLGTAVAGGQPVAVSDALGDDRFSTLGERASRGGYRSICCVPLIAKQRAIGGISAYYRAQQQFGDEQIRLLSAFADQAAIAVENARLYEQARRALVTKSALLLEMHHRVKNNLQTVAALLSLQQRRAKSPTVAQPLGESIARIQSIAAVHDLLSSEQVGQVTVGGLLKPIIEIATINLVPPGKRIEFMVAGQGVTLGSKEANVLALLLNELMANAIRHGMAGRDRGRITISATDDGVYTRISVCDDGAGLPSGFDLDSDAGLGLQIVQTLVRNDLRGRFDLRNERGTTAEITFSAPTIPLW